MGRTLIAKWFGMAVAAATLAATPLWAQAQPARTSVGPGRIVCRSSNSCELDIGTSAGLKYKIDPSGLAAADRDRLSKSCTIKAVACVATVTGTETASGVKAASIKFYN